MKHLSKFLSNLRGFFVTYAATIKIAWDMDRNALIKISLANALTGALVYPSLLINKMIIDAVVNTITTHQVTSGIRTILFAMLLEWLISRISDFLQEVDYIYSSTLPRVLAEEINVNVSRKINALPVAVAEDPKTRNLQQKVIDNSGRAVWSLVIPISTFPEIIFTLVSTAIPIFTFQPLLIIPTMILSVPSILIGIRFSHEHHALSTRSSSQWRVWSALEDFSIKGKYLYENKILGHVNILLKRRVKMTKKYFGSYNKINRGHSQRRQIVAVPMSLYQASVRFYLYYLAIIGRLTLGSAQITSSAVERFITNFGRLIRQANDIFQNYLFVLDYENLMKLGEETVNDGLLLPQSLDQGIEFRDVWFKYPHNPNWTLKGVSFKVNPTDNVAIVGENGAGKTTIIKLLSRFYEPSKGEILLNGINIQKYNIVDYRHHISALFQDFAQYPFSAKDNIRFGDIHKKLKRTDIRQAAELTGIDKFIKSLPQKYNNPLDKEFKDGIEPSKGQWQRIALARILYRDAQMLILDEPTSNVDPKSEEEIFEQVLRVAKNKIVLLVSHRFSTVRKADKILVLEDGIATEYGTHQELMDKNGRYKELFEIQAQSFR